MMTLQDQQWGKSRSRLFRQFSLPVLVFPCASTFLGELVASFVAWVGTRCRWRSPHGSCTRLRLSLTPVGGKYTRFLVGRYLQLSPCILYDLAWCIRVRIYLRPFRQGAEPQGSANIIVLWSGFGSLSMYCSFDEFDVFNVGVMYVRGRRGDTCLFSSLVTQLGGGA